MRRHDYILTYNLGDPYDPTTFDFYISRGECLDALVDMDLISQEQIDKLDGDIDLIDEILDEYDDDLKEYFREIAESEYDDAKEEEKDPYGFRGHSPKDFR